MKTQILHKCLNRITQVSLTGLMMLLVVLVLSFPLISEAATAEEINRDADNALKNLYRATPTAKEIAGISKGILVFPSIIKGGFVIGGQYGEGVLRKEGKTAGYYKSVAASYGLQIGAQSFGYALFFIDDESLEYLKKSDGWEIGVGPSIVIMDEGTAKSFTTTSVKSGVYVFFFNQKGLMAGIGIQGSKITEFKPGQ